MKYVEYRYYDVIKSEGTTDQLLTKCDAKPRMVGSGNCRKCDLYVGRNDEKTYIICKANNEEVIYNLLEDIKCIKEELAELQPVDVFRNKV